MESQQSFTGLKQQIEEEEKAVSQNAKFPDCLPTALDGFLHHPQEQNSPEATRMLPVSSPAATDLCNKTSNTTSCRSCRAHNPWAPYLARELAATCGDDAQGYCKSHPRNSPRQTPKALHQPSARTKAPLPAGKAMPWPIERGFVFSYSQGPATTLRYYTIIPHLDAS